MQEDNDHETNGGSDGDEGGRASYSNVVLLLIVRSTNAARL